MTFSTNNFLFPHNGINLSYHFNRKFVGSARRKVSCYHCSLIKVVIDFFYFNALAATILGWEHSTTLTMKLKYDICGFLTNYHQIWSENVWIVCLDSSHTFAIRYLIFTHEIANIGKFDPFPLLILLCFCIAVYVSVNFAAVSV